MTAVPTSVLDDDARYRALRSRDARFDGQFFTGVTSTGIYCRPICRVRTPRRENCRFFPHAAAAEQAGFRPCLRCRPELAPTQRPWSIEDAGAILATEALALLEQPDVWAGAPTSARALAARLGVSDRHLRRVFEAQLGASPLQVLLTHRLLAARRLLSDTRLPVTEVALSAGFSSLRRFNAAFADRYRMSPTRLRKTVRGPAGDRPAALRLAWRPPYDVAAMLDFWRLRQLPGVEWVDRAGGPPRMARTLALRHGAQTLRGWLALEFDPSTHGVRLWLAPSLQPALPAVLARVRSALDLDADPTPIEARLARYFPGTTGQRLPGAFDGFETAVRVILGQQVSMAAARTLAGRLVDRFGETLETPLPQLARLFPTADTLARAPADALAGCGLPRQRQRAVHALADAVASGALSLHPGVDVGATMDRLRALPGVGEWTVQTIALRALHWPDAWPDGDRVLRRHGGPAAPPGGRHRSLATLRGYALMRIASAAAAARADAGRPPAMDGAATASMATTPEKPL